MQATAGGEERSEESNNTNTDANANVDTNSNSDRNTNIKYISNTYSIHATAEGPKKSSNANTMMDLVCNEFTKTSTDTNTEAKQI